MPSFSSRSQEKLDTCHPDLIRLFKEVVKHYDCTILEGRRSFKRQEKLFAEGKSKTMNSKHLSNPSIAVDVAPYPIDWDDMQRFYMFVGIVRGVAATMDINVRCGADWDGDLTVKDQNFHDLPHFELIDNHTSS